MKLSIMQPYFFPYLGYFQLIQAVDRFVIYDDVNFTRRGWINRNFFLTKQGSQRITLQLHGASQNKLINAIEVGDNCKKILIAITQMYSKAPFYYSAFRVIESCLLQEEKNLACFLEFSLRKLSAYLNIETEILLSSQIEKDNTLKGPDKIIAICKQLGADIYINPIGGQTLYDKQRFYDEGLALFFLEMQEITYPQSRQVFVPNLSIIDLMMFNSRQKILQFLEEYTLV